MTDERKIIEQIQDGLKAMKSGLRDLEAINTKEGRLAAANDAMGLRGDLLSWHCKATKSMNEHFPEFASQIQTRGPGGR